MDELVQLLMSAFKWLMRHGEAWIVLFFLVSSIGSALMKAIRAKRVEQERRFDPAGDSRTAESERESPWNESETDEDEDEKEEEVEAAEVPAGTSDWRGQSAPPVPSRAFPVPREPEPRIVYENRTVGQGEAPEIRRDLETTVGKDEISTLSTENFGEGDNSRFSGGVLEMEGLRIGALSNVHLHASFDDEQAVEDAAAEAADTSPGRTLLLGSDLRSALLMKEILGPPISMREAGSRAF